MRKLHEAPVVGNCAERCVAHVHGHDVPLTAAYEQHLPRARVEQTVRLEHRRAAAQRASRAVRGHTGALGVELDVLVVVHKVARRHLCQNISKASPQSF